MLAQHRSRRKVSGGKYKIYRKKKKYELARYPGLTKLGERKLKKLRVLGGNRKNRLLAEKLVNVADKTGKVLKLEIKGVVDNPADRHLVRRNIITKGTVIETEKGKARVTSRPGQDGVVNAVLVG